MKRWNLVAVALLLVAPSALSAQEDADEMKYMDADVTAAITEAAEAMEAAWNAADWTAVAGSYTDDAVVMPMGMEALEGTEAIAAFFEGTPPGWNLDLQTKEVFSVEGAALEVGRWVMTGDEGSHLDHGSYMVAWAWTDDGWKMTRDIWNSNMAPAED